MRSAHSRTSQADIMSRPVAFDFLSLLRSEKMIDEQTSSIRTLLVF